MASFTQIYTHLNYGELFREFTKAGIILPVSYLKNAEDIQEHIATLLSEIDPIELIGFSSFLNMICQSHVDNDNVKRGITFLQEAQLAPHLQQELSKKILFHRENFLAIIGLILQRQLSGREKLTGTGNLTNKQNYVKALLWQNEFFNKSVSQNGNDKTHHILKGLIRDWPYSENPAAVTEIYRNRIVRYQHCYNTLISNLHVNAQAMMQNAINAFQAQSGISLESYMRIVSHLFCWYLDAPSNKESKPDISGFKYPHINTFYINPELFSTKPDYIKTIEILACDLASLMHKAHEQQKNTHVSIEGCHQHIRVFFDNPILKIDCNQYCIMDMKFFLENACGSLLWRLGKENRISDFKAAYGFLIEEHFKFLIRKMFNNAQISFGDKGGADAVIETDDTIIVMEFTTEYFRISSLYNSDSTDFLNDVYRLLFNQGKNDPKARGKKDKGKLFKLNTYLEAEHHKGKTLIPVLVTENPIGNPDLLNNFNNFYDTNISNNNLAQLQQTKPVFLSLDDLEICWGLFGPNNLVTDFIKFVNYWISSNKGQHLHNASIALCDYVSPDGEAEIVNDEYKTFFSKENLYKLY